MKISDLLEVRVDTSEYTTKDRAGILDRVIVKLSGHDAGRFTKLIKRFSNTDSLIKNLERKREAAKKEMKDEFPKFFDVEDEVLTRVIETAQVSMTLAKGFTKAKDAEKQIQYAELLEELGEIMDDELKPILTDLIKKHTKIIDAVKSKKVANPKFDFKVFEGDDNINESILDIPKMVLDKLKGYIVKYYNKIKSKLSSYDSKLDNIKNKAKNI